jgi:nucleoside-diphosphate-sugar epimerase
MKALVVGGTGPTGPLVVAGLMERGYDVAILHTGKHEADLPAAVEHIHGDPHFLEPLEEAFDSRTFDVVVAMYGRLRHLASVVRGKTARLVAAGGAPYAAFVLGEKEGTSVPVLIREDAPLFRDEGRNKFTYLITLSEEAVMAAHGEGSYNATILRFPMIYGPRQVAPREWSIIRRILDGRRRLILPDGGLKLERRGYADNVAAALLLAVDKPLESAGQIYNVGDERVWSLKEWVEGIARVMGHQWELVSMPFAAARPARPYGGRNFHWVTDIDKIRNGLGYRDVVPAEAGLERTVKWYLDHRPDEGGEIERSLQDPFDYEGEDRLIEDYARRLDGIRDVYDHDFRFHHGYSHPKKPVP